VVTTRPDAEVAGSPYGPQLQHGDTLMPPYGSPPARGSVGSTWVTAGAVSIVSPVKLVWYGRNTWLFFPG